MQPIVYLCFQAIKYYIYNQYLPLYQMRNFEYNTPYIETKLSIEKALEFVGDNSPYQKKRLAILSYLVLTTGILTCFVPLLAGIIPLLFMFASGAGQIICPIYMSLGTCAFGILGFTCFGLAFYPVSDLLSNFVFLGLGFFGRGMFVSSLIYINEIGGDRFRAWSPIVIFGMWGLSSLISTLKTIFTFPVWVWYYFFIFFPFLIGSLLVLRYWQPSPYRLYMKNDFKGSLEVLNKIAIQNQRPMLPYGIQGQNQQQSLSYRKPTYWDFIQRPIIRKITIPLLVVWVYRQYIYYGGYFIIPELGRDYTKIYFLLSISEIISVLLSYPIKLKIKRTNTFFFCSIVIGIFSLLSSFTVIDPECMLKAQICATKHIYRISIFMLHFASSLLGNILVSYTLEIYPSNVRSMGFSLCLGVSSLGSIFVPSISEFFIYADLSGFISFAIVSIVAIYFANKLTQTYGKMRTQTLQAIQQNSPHISLTSWATLNF